MYLKLGNKKFSLHVYFTQKKVSLGELKDLTGYLKQCTAEFEQFITKKTLSPNTQSIRCSMTICGIKKISSLNRKYRGFHKKTDVLSFPVHEDIKTLWPKEYPLLDLGDIYICREMALSQARQFNISYPWEVVHLLVHGWLHLLGYDHEISQTAQKQMETLEAQLLEKIERNFLQGG